MNNVKKRLAAIPRLQLYVYVLSALAVVILGVSVTGLAIGLAGIDRAALLDRNASNLVCAAPLNASCIPPVHASNLVCDALIDSSCIPAVAASDLVCDAPLNAACIPPVNTSNLVCDAPLNAACIPPVSASDLVCNTSALSDSCVPLRIGSVNMIHPDALSKDFTITGGPGVGIQGLPNGVRIVNIINITLDVGFFVVKVQFGIISVDLKDQLSNTVLAAPTNETGIPFFRLLEPSDIPILSLNDLDRFSGVLPVSLGGTGTNVSTLANNHELLIGPISGGPSLPTYRTLTVSDLTSLGMTNGQLIIGSASGSPIVGNLINGSNIVITNTPGGIMISASINASAIGTVFSVNVALPSSVFSTSGGPVTDTGTITGSFIDQPANTVFAAPDGSAGTPQFRLLNVSDLPVLQDNQIFIGQGSGTTVVSTLVAGQAITITNAGGITMINSTALTSSVDLVITGPLFSVGGNPVTTTGTLTATLNVQNANTIFAGPLASAGPDGAPTFRALDITDLTGLNMTDGQLIIGSTGNAPIVGKLINGSNIVITSTPSGIVISSAINGSAIGTVMYIDIALPGSVFSVTGGPVTTSGTIAGSFISQPANTFFAGPASGSGPGTPAFRPISLSDLPLLSTDQIVIGQGGLAATSTLTAGSGIVITNAAGITLINTTAHITSVDLSITGPLYTVSGGPVTTAGTLTATLNTQPANTIFAGSASGTTSVPTFRQLVIADLPPLSPGDLYIGTSSGVPIVSTISAGSGITITPGSGTLTIGTVSHVNSVGLAITGPLFTIAGSPVTTSGTLTATLNTQLATLVFAGPVSGGAATPTFRMLMPTDIPALDVSQITTGTLSIAHGGTNSNSALSNNRVIVSSGGSLVEGPLLTNGQLLIGSSSALPVAATLTPGIGISIINAAGSITLANTGVTSVGLILPTSLFSVSGSPVTTTGTLSGLLVNQVANAIFAGPVGGNATAPAFRMLVPADIPLLDASQISMGVLPIARGGTNSGAALNNDRLLVSSGGAIVEANAMTNGQLLIGSTGGAPAVGAVGAGNGIAVVVCPGSIGISILPSYTQFDLNVSDVLTVNNVVCAGPALPSSCFPSSAHFSMLTVDQLFVTNDTVSVVSFAQTVNMQNVFMNGTMTCTGAGIISNGCLPAHVTSVGLALPTSVFTVSGTPVTTTGTLSGSFIAQAATTVFAGPSSGGNAVPTFRTLTQADVPNLDASIITTGILPIANGGTNSGTALHNNRLIVSSGGALVEAAALTNGQLLIGSTAGAPMVGTISAGNAGVTIAVGAGTIGISNAMSVGVTVPSFLSVSGSPLTAAGGTIAITLAPELANTVFAGPSMGAASAPTFRALIQADIPLLDASIITTGLLPIARGGTNSGTALNNNRLIVSSGGSLVEAAALATGQFLVGSTSGAPIPGTIVAGNAGISVAFGPGTIGISNAMSVAVTVPSFLSVAGSPLTAAGGTIAISLTTESANTIFAGPVSGGLGVPTFRTQVLADLPQLTNGQLYVGSTGASVVRTTLTPGLGISIANAAGSITIANTGVTSVGLVLPPSIFTVTGSPVTTTGTLTGALAVQSANAVFAGPSSGGSATPTFRLLTATDIPLLDASAIATGVFPIVRGGTNSGAALNNNRVMVSSGGSIVEATALTNGQLLIGSTGLAPVAASITPGNGITIGVGAGSISVSIAPSYTQFDLSVSDILTVNNVVCSGPALPASCLPSTAHFTTLTVDQLFVTNDTVSMVSFAQTVNMQNVFMNGTMTCTGAGTISASCLPVTVTSVGLALPASVFTVSGSPVTSTGTLTGSFVSQAANTVFAGPSTGAAMAPTFRPLVRADIPSLDASAISTGILPVARGGTNSGTTLNNNRIMVSSGGSIVEALALTNGQLLIGSTGSTPAVGTITAGNAGITVALGTGTIAVSNAMSVALTVPSFLSVAGSPLTAAGGTIAISLATETANTIFAGPASGIAATPTFRALVAADIPSLDAAIITTGVLPIARGGTSSGTALVNNRIMISTSGAIVEAPALTNGQLLIGSTGLSPVPATLTNGLGISISVGVGAITVSNTGVTNVALALPPSIFTVTGSPVTTTGILTGSLVSQNANLVFAGPSSGGPLAPTFRSLAAADIPSLDVSKITTGTLPIVRGGTNSAAALANNRVMVSAGGAIVESAALTNGQLVIGSTGLAPVIGTLTPGTGISIVNAAGSITVANTGVTSVGLALPPSIFTVTGSPVTTTGTLTGLLAVQTASTVFAGPTSGAATAPTFRLLVPTDMPNLDASIIATGILPIARGGTNSGTALNNNRIMISSGGSIVETAAALTNGQLLVGSTGGAPVATAITPGNGISVTNGPGSITLAIPASYTQFDLNVSDILTVNNVVCSGPALPSSCLPSTAHFTTLTVDQLFVTNDTVSMVSFAQTVNMQNVFMNGTMTCTGAGTISASCLPVTVTSIGLALPASVFTVSGSPVTSTGTLTGAFATQAANTVFAGPTTGAVMAPTFRTLVRADIPNLDALAISTGILPVARGGTSSGAALNNNRLMVSSGGAIVEALALTNGQLLIGSTGSAPAVGTITAGNAGISVALGTGTITVSNTMSVALTVPSFLSVAGSPLTAAGGTIAISLATETANTIFAGPGSGVAATPTFRALVAADIPSLDAAIIATGTLPIARGGTNSASALANNRVMVSAGGAIVESAALANGQLVIGSTGLAPVIGTLTPGTGISIVNAAGSITVANTGVTSVGLALPPSIFTVSGSPVTTTGTLTGSLASQNANLVFAGPSSGGPLAPTFRSLVAADIPSLDASKITTGTLPIARGGTNSATALANNRVMVSTGGAIVEAAALTNGQLFIGSTGLAPVLGTLTPGTGISIVNAAGSITVANTGVTSVGLVLPPSIFTVLGSPVTTTGTLTGALAVQTANTVFAGPATGAATAPTFRLLVSTDIPNLDASIITTGIVPIARGGTNSGTALNNNRIMISSGGSIVETAAALTNGQLLVGSTGGAPVAAAITPGNGISVTNGPGAITVAIPTSYTQFDLTVSDILNVNNVVCSGPALPASCLPLTAHFTTLTVDQLFVTNDTVSMVSFVQTVNMQNVFMNGTMTCTGAGTISASCLPVTVTSVGLALPASVFTVSGSPVTSTGTLTGAFATQAANSVFAGPASGGAVAPTFRALVSADIPNLDASRITTGTLPVARGGTSSGAALNNNRIMVSSGGAIVESLALTNGQLLIGSSGLAPTVGAITAGNAGITIALGAGTISVSNAMSVALTVPSFLSVTGSPLTGAGGTLAITLATETANTVFAGPASGGAIAPTFRALVAADIPSLDASAIATGTLPVSRGGTGSGTALVNGRIMVSSGGAIVEAAALTNGQLLIGSTGLSPVAATLTGGTGISIAVGAGSITVSNTGVTSVALSLPASIFTVTGSPVTNTGTLTGSLATQTANLVFAGPPSGGALAPTFRALVAADVPNLDTSKLTTGIVPIARGGTNSGTALSNSRIMVSAGGAIVEAAALTNGQLLIGSTGAAPVAASITGTANQVIVANGVGSITLSTPQNIHTAATPMFASEFLTATTNQLVLGTTNTLTISSTALSVSRTYTIADAGANANFVLDTGGALTITNAASIGAVLTGTGAATASWQAASSGSITVVKSVTAKGAAQASSANAYTTLNSVSLTTGTWQCTFEMVVFNAANTGSNANGYDFEIASTTLGSGADLDNSFRHVGDTQVTGAVTTAEVVVSAGASPLTVFAEWKNNAAGAAGDFVTVAGTGRSLRCWKSG
jgi:coenzyme F420-reducing hydrogenase gamma subunit